MDDNLTYEHLIRLARLLQAEERSSGPILQPVQLHALHYLSRCNRYSDRPATVAEYLGITKGTASQTLRVLEQAGYIAKQADPEDRRVVHVSLTARGQRVLDQAGARSLLDRATRSMSTKDQEQLARSMTQLLRALQRANHSRPFGTCQTCRHFKAEGDGKFRCGLTLEPLAASETELICREHEERAMVGVEG